MMYIQLFGKVKLSAVVVFVALFAVGADQYPVPTSNVVCAIERGIASDGLLPFVGRICEAYTGYELHPDAATNEFNNALLNRLIRASLVAQLSPTNAFWNWREHYYAKMQVILPIPEVVNLESNTVVMLANDYRDAYSYQAANYSSYGWSGMNIYQFEAHLKRLNSLKTHYREQFRMFTAAPLRKYFQGLPCECRESAVSNFLATSSMTSEEFDALMRPEDSADAEPPPSH